jgi:hypothetical protein
VTPQETILVDIQIGRATSVRGDGISLREALKRVKYSDIRSSIDSDDVDRLLRENIHLIDAWVMYSGDKRTSSGW